MVAHRRWPRPAAGRSRAAGGPVMDHFRAWVRGHGGEAFTGAGVEIGAHQLVPDLTFVGPERAGELDADGFHVPPDLVVEVTSPGTRSLDLVEKRAVYETIGVGEYWVVDLVEQRVIVHRRDAQGAYQAAEHVEGTLSTEQAPGLQVPVGAPAVPRGRPLLRDVSVRRGGSMVGRLRGPVDGALAGSLESQCKRTCAVTHRLRRGCRRACG
ncbi:MAG: Uma2 family endonuclease [Egibacteraceae bacterium]